MSIDITAVSQEAWHAPVTLPVVKSARVCARSVTPVYHFALTTLGITLCATVMWLIAARTAQMTVVSYATDRLQSQIGQLSSENGYLSTRLDILKQPTHMLALALGPLHMQWGMPLSLAKTSTRANH